MWSTCAPSISLASRPVAVRPPATASCIIATRSLPSFIQLRAKSVWHPPKIYTGALMTFLLPCQALWRARVLIIVRPRNCPCPILSPWQGQRGKAWLLFLCAACEPEKKIPGAVVYCKLYHSPDRRPLGQG